MAAISSQLAAISYSGQASTAIGSVGISNTRNLIESTEIGDSRTKFLAGNGGMTAQCEIYYDQGDAACAAMETAANGGTSATLLITLSTGMTYSGTAFVTEFSPTASINDIVRANVTFQYTGTVTIA